jgi:hypothetical protein
MVIVLWFLVVVTTEVTTQSYPLCSQILSISAPNTESIPFMDGADGVIPAMGGTRRLLQKSHFHLN